MTKLEGQLKLLGQVEKKFHLISGTFGQKNPFCKISYVELPEDSWFDSYFIYKEFNSKGEEVSFETSSDFTSFVEILNDIAMNTFGAKLY